MAFLVSLSSNTEYTVTSDKPYTEEYYTIDVEDPPDYREYYGSISTTDATKSCKTTNFSAQGKKIEGSTGYWFVNNMTVNPDELDDHITAHHRNNDSTKDIDYYVVTDIFTTGNYIIMPYSGTLQVDSKTNDCRSMTVYCSAPNGTEYKLVIYNMDCWYCDVSRENPTYHTSDEQKGKKFLAGNVLGKANAGTTIKIIPIKNGSAIGTSTLSQFYNGWWEDFDDDE